MSKKYLTKDFFFLYYPWIYTTNGYSMERIVFHIDVNSAFLSWSAKQVLEQGYKVDIRERVSVVWVEEKRKCFVLAASMPAKKLGIKTAMNLYRAKELYPGLIIAPPDYKYYKQCSNELIKLLRKYFPTLQQYSIDECFVEYSEDIRDYWDPITVATELKDFIKKKLWFTVNIGIGNNKFLAKMASDFEKPNKVHTLYKNEIKEKMWPLAIWELFGCWRRMEPELRKMGIQTIWDLAHKDKQFLWSVLGNYWKVLWELANGEDNTKVIDNYDERKGMGASSITRIDTHDRDFIISFLERFAVELELGLMDKELSGNVINVWVRHTDFTYKSHQHRLSHLINTADKIYEYALLLFDELWHGEDINLVGLGISWLKKTEFKQNALFSLVTH